MDPGESLNTNIGTDGPGPDGPVNPPPPPPPDTDGPDTDGPGPGPPQPPVGPPPPGGPCVHKVRRVLKPGGGYAICRKNNKRVTGCGDSPPPPMETCPGISWPFSSGNPNQFALCSISPIPAWVSVLGKDATLTASESVNVTASVVQRAYNTSGQLTRTISRATSQSGSYSGSYRIRWPDYPSGTQQYQGQTQIPDWVSWGSTRTDTGSPATNYDNSGVSGGFLLGSDPSTPTARFPGFTTAYLDFTGYFGFYGDSQTDVLPQECDCADTRVRFRNWVIAGTYPDWQNLGAGSCRLQAVLGVGQPWFYSPPMGPWPLLANGSVGDPGTYPGLIVNENTYINGARLITGLTSFGYSVTTTASITQHYRTLSATFGDDEYDVDINCSHTLSISAVMNEPCDTVSPRMPLPPGLDENGQPVRQPGQCAGCGQ